MKCQNLISLKMKKSKKKKLSSAAVVIAAFRLTRAMNTSLPGAMKTSSTMGPATFFCAD